VLETRSFSRLGESRARSFRGKLIAATNRELAKEIREGRFREDLYYRLCADTVTTPSLAERLSDTPEELPLLVGFLAQRLVGDEEAPAVAVEVVAWIRANLDDDYPWPGNVRELMQCTSNVLVRGSYEPAGRRAAGDGAASPAGPHDRLAAELAAGTLSADEVLNRYCTLVYADTGSYVEAAERLGLDRRTVRGRVDRELARALRASRPASTP
jgi:DNA-binding NtrC family response regulator